MKNFKRKKERKKVLGVERKKKRKKERKKSREHFKGKRKNTERKGSFTKNCRRKKER